MQLRINHEKDPLSLEGVKWEALVSSTPAAGFMQSLHWARLKSKQDMESLHLTLYDGNRLVGGGLFYSASANKGSNLLICPEGPILPWSDEVACSEAMELLLQAAQQHAASTKSIAVRIEPRLAQIPMKACRGFVRAPVDLVPRETLYLDLRQTEDELLASMRPKGRYNIRLSERHGVIVRPEQFSGLAVRKLYAMLLQASRRDGFLLEPLSFFARLTESLSTTGMAKMLFAEHDGETIGALLLITYGIRATYLYGGISNNKRNLMAGYALQWKAMQLAKAAGCQTYDLYGFDRFCAPQNQYARFSRFKRQFGGQPIRFVGAHDYFFLNRLADAVVQAIHEIERAPARSPQLASK